MDTWKQSSGFRKRSIVHASLRFWDQSCSLLTCIHTVESTTKLTSGQIFCETLKPQGHVLVAVLRLCCAVLFIKTTKEFLSLHTHRYSPKYPFLQIKGLFLWSEAPAYYGSTVVGCKQLITLLHHSQQPPVCSGHREISLNLRPVQPCHLVF